MIGLKSELCSVKKRLTILDVQYYILTDELAWSGIYVSFHLLPLVFTTVSWEEEPMNQILTLHWQWIIKECIGLFHLQWFHEMRKKQSNKCMKECIGEVYCTFKQFHMIKNIYDLQPIKFTNFNSLNVDHVYQSLMIHTLSSSFNE